MLRVASRRISPASHGAPTHLPRFAWCPAAAALAGGLHGDDSSHDQKPCFAIESLVTRNQDVGLAELPATTTALKNPSAKIVYDEYNHQRYSPEWLVVIGVCTHLGCIPLPYCGG